MSPQPSQQTLRAYGQFLESTIDPEATLDLIAGRPRILVFRETPKRIYIPDENVARFQVIYATEISLVGSAPGRTVLNIWVEDPAARREERVLSYLLNVYPEPRLKETLEAQFEALEQEINQAFPASRVDLGLLGDRLLVRGQAKDAIEASQILQVLVQDSSRRGRRNETDARALYVYEDRDVLLDRDEAGLRRSVLDPELLAQAGIINLLQIPGEQQVLLRVTVAEVNRSALRSIGADAQLGPGGELSFISLALPGVFPGTGGNFSVNTPDFRLALNALRQLGYARTLAEPNLTTLNGRPASFQAGDRLPVPFAQAGFGGVGQGVGFEFVGVQLTFTPYVVDRDRVRLDIAGFVSTIDDQRVANIGGTNVNGQNTRNFRTTVELRDSQTMALAGLIQTSLRGNANRVPVAGDWPFVGTLFGTKSSSATEQELIVIVTPELVHPLEACETPPLPGYDVFEPTDVEFYLANQLESRRSRDFRSPVRTDAARQHAGEVACEDSYIIGPHGPTYGCCNANGCPSPLPIPATSSLPLVPRVTADQ
ncbi:MAG: type II and III secretion system protein family protein [Pirellulaceae bacterium]